jgi:hypothetical protein
MFAVSGAAATVYSIVSHGRESIAEDSLREKDLAVVTPSEFDSG